MAKGKEKNTNIASFSEEDSAALEEKYGTNTYLKLLQEMANYQNPKFDWNKLVKETTTGISNAREYQMLWRHLAYGHPLEENLDDNAEPLDDDSDIECKREEPSSITEQSALPEVEACVKVMTASHKLSESGPSRSLITAPLTISVPISGSSDANPNVKMQEKNIIVPVTIPMVRVPPHRRAKEQGDRSDNNMVTKRMKVKHWSEEEDKHLLDLIEKWGEGNWAYMAKREDFPLDKTPQQMAKRWSTLRKKQGNNKSEAGSSNSECKEE